jgi:hypothetical protein
MTSPLHGGKAPAWLFGRMKLLAREIVCAMREDHEAEVVLAKLSDPYWFQCLGCVLGFDWHSSGVTTTVCGALKEGVKGIEADLGLWVAGGKGKASRRTPEEIARACEACGAPGDRLVYSSRMSAKVDSSAVQDGYQIYHHAFFFTRRGEWAVVQQGMDETSRTARRYHWLGEGVQDFVCEPHAAIAADERRQQVLNLVAGESGGCREASTEIARSSPMQSQKLAAALPRRHEVDPEKDVDPRHLHRVLVKTYEAQPRGFEELLGIRGVGPKALRALSLLSEVIHGEAPSFRDPARFSYAHGGKDGTPYPVDRRTYDSTIETVKRAVEASKVGNRTRLEAIRRLARFYDI